MSELTHLDDQGAARMVEVGGKPITARSAVAGADVTMRPETLALIERGAHKKGDVLAVARIAGIQAAKKCADLIPLCHPLMLTSVEVDLFVEADAGRVRIEARCAVTDRTGVEMEAMTAAAIAALTLYDMCKSVDRGIEVQSVRLLSKEGGKSGVWRRDAQGGA